jgi:hypothetical protein
MMVSSPDIARPRHAPEPVRITNWPLMDDGLTAWAMVAGMIAVGAIAGAVAGSPFMGVITILALAISVWRLWFPITFDFSSRGVVQTCWRRQRRIPWPQIARYEVLSRGVLLSADEEPAPLAPLRSIYVSWNEQRDELVRLLEFFLGEDPPEA